MSGMVWSTGSRAVARGRRRGIELTYAVAGERGSRPSLAAHRAVHQALSTWAGWTGLRFLPVPGDGGPDLLVRAGDEGCGSCLGDLPGAVPGSARREASGAWTVALPPAGGPVDLTAAALHQIGHALGLAHSPVPGAVMEPFHDRPRRVLAEDDVARAMALHGDYAIAESTWLHGSAVAVERPEDLVSSRPFGFFTRIVGRPGTTNAFHFALPTTVVLDGERRVIGPCMARFQTGSPAAAVRAVQVYDGELRVAAHEGLDLWGPQPFRRFGVAHGPEARWGVNVSVVAAFGDGTDEDRAIDLIGAGCDLLPADPWPRPRDGVGGPAAGRPTPRGRRGP